MKVVLWLGPVSTSNISSAVPDDWQIRTYNHGAGGGIGSSAFREWAQTLGDDPLSVLAPGATEIILAGFSAAHGATEIILQKVAARKDKRLRALLSVDSYYVSDASNRFMVPKPGHLAWLKQIIAARDGRKAIFTTSNYAGADYESARNSFWYVAKALEMQPGALALLAPEMPVPPKSVQHRGPVVWLNYDYEFAHTEHATKLAPKGLKTLISQHSERQEPDFGLLILLGLFAAWQFAKSKWRK